VLEKGNTLSAVSKGKPSVFVAPLGDDFETPKTESAHGNSRGSPSVVVVDVLRAKGQPPGLLAQSVAEIARNSAFEVSIFSGADVQPAWDETEQKGARIVLVPIYLAPTDGRALVDALSLWEAPAALCEELTRAGVVVVAVMGGAPAALLAGCISNGAIGLTSSEDLNRVFIQLRDAIDTNGPNDSRLNKSRVDRPILPSQYKALISLTMAERRILLAMMQGWSASDIANALVVSILTVRTHIRSVLAKLNVSSQIAAVAIGYGADPGDVQVDEPAP
jgi:DNA-binding NarL/FixJ family response regulator